ncbi:MAG: helix-turn-helix domain-containing protein [Lachnospiraceae bacterium]|nr:helix-turn-helix domain-containing protein [Lachnospiraceae bacterium]
MKEDRVRRRYELADHICYSVCSGNESQALRAVREWNELGASGRLPDELTEWKYDLIWLTALMMQSLRGIGVPDFWLENARMDYMERIDRAESVPECHRLAEESAAHFCKMNSLKETRRYSMLVRTVLQTIEEDLTQPLTLGYFSKLLNVNGSYLSNLFRNEVGMTLTEYVTSQRISYAAELLLTTQNQIQTVAKKAGIPDVQYFSRLFKKRTGKTPSQYRGTGRQPQMSGPGA